MMKTLTSIANVAEYLLTKAPMSPKKLQKLCYYAYAWHLAVRAERLFSERFEAWVHGPVEPGLYQAYRHFGWHEIPKVQNTPSLHRAAIDTIDRVYAGYGHLSGDQLALLSHLEAPWQQARSGIDNSEPSTNQLDDDVIKAHFQAKWAGVE